jgi:heptosyltransferase-3
MKRILLIAVPGIGDAFLATPLIGALKHAYPNACIDVLVRDGRAVLDGNPDISRVLVQPRRPPFRDSVRFLARIFRSYDLAISTSTTDRSFIVLLVAAPIRIGKVASMKPETWWKRRLVRNYVLVDPEVHVLSENLRIADALGVERRYAPALPQLPQQSTSETSSLPFEPGSGSFAVIHMKPGAIVRQWPEDYWDVLIESLRKRGIAVVATGGGSPSERTYVEGIVSRASTATGAAPVWSLAGELPFHEFTRLVRQATLFIGTDTSATHVAAATGIPTVALFGPTDPVRWGPWPMGLEQDGSPWRRHEASQRRGNVTLLRGSCGCHSRRQACRQAPGMPGACMSRLPPETVLATVDAIVDQLRAADRLHSPAKHAAGARPAGDHPLFD